MIIAPAEVEVRQKPYAPDKDELKP
jgi:hypothetical protein